MVEPKNTMLLAFSGLKFVPEITTVLPGIPDRGEKELIVCGGAVSLTSYREGISCKGEVLFP